MTTTALETQGALTAAQIRANVNLIQEVMKAVMKDKEHYGVIPGCAKPSLWKPGAEKLLSTFRVASSPVIEDLSSPDEARYRVTRNGTNLNGAFLGAGIGEASSSEEKYKWRGAVCDAEFEATTEDRRRLKYFKDGTTRKQIRTNIADVANTILKMADKRAYVALALNVTAASDIFAQDLEDLPEGYEAGEAAPAPIKKPEARKATPSTEEGDSAEFIPAAVDTKPTKNGSTKLGIKAPDGTWYSEFGTTNEDLARTALAESFAIRVKFKVSGQFKNIISVEKV